MAETIFNKIIRKEIPAQIVFENDEILAFRDVSPQAPLHVLIIPKKTISTLNDATDADVLLIGKIVLAAAEIAKKEGISENGYRLVMNCNQDGGQSVYHLHFHLLGGRKLTWPPG